MYTQEIYKGVNVEVNCLVHLSTNRQNHFYITDKDKMATGSIKLSGVAQLSNPTFTLFQSAYVIFYSADTEYEIIFGLPGTNFSIIVDKKSLQNMLNIIEGKPIDPTALNEANLSEHGIFPISIFSYIYMLKYYEEGKEAAQVFITSLHSKGDYSGYIFQKKSFRQRNLIDFTCSVGILKDTYYIEVPHIHQSNIGASLTIEISKDDMKHLREIIS